MTNDLEFLRDVFRDPRLHVGIGIVTKTGLSLDGNTLRVMVNLLPENRGVMAVVAWDDVLDISFPIVNDLVLVAFIDGHPDEGFMIKSITGPEEQIPKLAQAGNMVKYSRPGKKAYFGSDTKIGIARPDVDPDSPLVLGDVLLNGLNALVNAFLNASQVGQCAVGSVEIGRAHV